VVTNSILQLALLFALFLVLCKISVGDWRYRRVPNASIVILLSLLIIICGDDIQFKYSIFCLLIGGLLWKMNFVGAGDIKLATVLLIGIQPMYLLELTMLFAISTSILLFVMWLCDRLQKTGHLENAIPMAIPISVTGFIGVLATNY
jgi:prepilin peptidase CpaA